MSEKKRPWWLLLLILIGGIMIGFGMKGILTGPSEILEPHYLATHSESGWDVICGESRHHLEHPKMTMDDCLSATWGDSTMLVEHEPCEPEIQTVTRWRDADCPEHEPCEDCPVPVWNCQESPCPADCEVTPGDLFLCQTDVENLTALSMAGQVALKECRDHRQEVVVGWENDLSDVVCYYNEAGGPVEAARLSVLTEYEVTEEEIPLNWSARFGAGEDRTLTMGLSRRVYRRFSVFAGATWVTDTEEISIGPDPYHRETLLFEEDNLRWRAGVEVDF